MEAVEVTAIELNEPNEGKKKKVTLFFEVLTISDINSNSG